MRARLAAWVELGRIQAGSLFIYRANYIFGLLGVLLQVYLLRIVWTSVYADTGGAVEGSGGVGTITLSTQIAYVTLASVQHWLLFPWAFTDTGARIRDGKIAIDLVRPVPFLTQTVVGKVGATVAMAPFALLALPFAIAIGGAEPPASSGAAFAYAVSLLGAYAISTLLNTTVGLAAFWTLENQGMFMIYRMVSSFLAGALVPLWFMPDWLRVLTQWLPFQASTYTPVAIYLGRIDGGDLTIALLTQVGWIVLLWLLLRLVWSRALHRVVVQGG